MIEKLDQVFQKHVFAGQSQDWQCQGIDWYRRQRLRDVSKAMGGMLVKVTPPQQSPPQQVPAVTPAVGDQLVNGGFITPDELASLGHHAAEEIYIFSRSIEFRGEGSFNAVKNAFLEQHIAGAGLVPIHLVSGHVPGAIEKSASSRPSGRIMLEMRQYRTEDTLNPKLLLRFKKEC